MLSFHFIVPGLLAAIYSLQRGVSAGTDITCGGQFPKAGDGLAKRTDGCSSWSDNPTRVRDSWGSASFRGVCDEHDRCYYTLCANVDECNRNFCDGLRNACRKAYCKKILSATVCEPLTYGSCLQIAETFCAAVMELLKAHSGKKECLERFAILPHSFASTAKSQLARTTNLTASKFKACLWKQPNSDIVCYRTWKRGLLLAELSLNIHL
ncbi:hypothetical protein BDV30DRAFT_217472 [Aspergillus minisclerotigenes]|uniref:Uncharacterized protein n=1 Tax=Aspergillus minisclerotigenes TaxID=656917 RepID=A0A5N6IUX8_9EURO|nr:hypothetical protein BDV30DRAFT_217472 [Aspergillus minisclerotigenes]